MAAVAGLATFAWSLPRGLDLSDEGYYLTEIAHPADTTATALLFGWVWHPVYAVTGGSVLGLRIAAVVLVAAVAATLGLTLAGLRPRQPGTGRTVSAATGVVTAALALIPLSLLPATPSYNTLAWLALAIAATGCALAWSGRRPLVGGVLVGLGGFLAVTSKPTTALALALIVVGTTPWRRTGRRSVVAAVAALGVASALLVVVAPGHLGGLVEVVRRGVDATVGHPDLLRLDPFSWPLRVLLPMGVAGLTGGLAGWVARRHPLIGAALGAAPIAAALASLTLWRDSGALTRIDLWLPLAGLTTFGPVLSGSAILVAARRGAASRDPVVIRMAILLVLLPAAYAVGTNVNLWRTMGQTVVFGFLAVLLLVGTQGFLAAAAGALATYTILVTAVVTPLAPYRSAPFTSTESVQVASSGERLRLPPAEASSMSEMLTVGQRLGVSRDTRVLDLTGMSPGVVWAWGARPLASGWVIGGYPTSREAARVAIAPAICEVDRALLLWAPDQRRAIPADVLSPWGVRVPEDYRAVATFPRITSHATLTDPTAEVVTVTVLEPLTAAPRGCP